MLGLLQALYVRGTTPLILPCLEYRERRLYMWQGLIIRDQLESRYSPALSGVKQTFRKALESFHSGSHVFAVTLP